jgi:hypothetical protein
MKADSLTYRLKDLLLVGVLLSYGSSAEKARILFEIYDDTCSHQLDSFTLRHLIEDLYALTVLRLPILTTAQAIDFDISKVLGYIEQIKFRGERGKEKLANAFLEGRLRLTQEEFIEYLTRDSNVRLLFTWGIRDYLFKVYQQIPSTRHFKVAQCSPVHARSSLKKTRSKSTAHRVSFAAEMVSNIFILSASESDSKSS